MMCSVLTRRRACVFVAKVLDRGLKRQVTVDGVNLTGKSKRRPDVELCWRDLLSGDVSLAAALNASLTPQSPIDSATKQAHAIKRGTKSPLR